MDVYMYGFIYVSYVCICVCVYVCVCTHTYNNKWVHFFSVISNTYKVVELIIIIVVILITFPIFDNEFLHVICFCRFFIWQLFFLT